MTGFKYFHRVIKEKGGIWNSDDVYFSQIRGCIFADVSRKVRL